MKFIDMPPEPWTFRDVFQTPPVDGLIVVTTPQDLVGMNVKKPSAWRRCEQTRPRPGGEYVLLTCPELREAPVSLREGQSVGNCGSAGLPLIASLPINPQTADFSIPAESSSADVRS